MLLNLPVAADQTVKPKHAAASSTSAESASLQGRHFLMAEDNEINAEIAESMLEIDVYKRQFLGFIKQGEYSFRSGNRGLKRSDDVRGFCDRLGNLIDILHKRLHRAQRDDEMCIRDRP